MSIQNMELNSDIWDKITSFLAKITENEANAKKLHIWDEFGRLFRDLRRISKKARTGVISYQRRILNVWFDPQYTAPLDKSNIRSFSYGNVLDIVHTQVNYPNGIVCPYRFRSVFQLKKHNISTFSSGFTTYIVNSEHKQRREDIWSKLFPNVDDPLTSSQSLSLPDRFPDHLLEGIIITFCYVDTPNEVNIFTRSQGGKRHGPSIIHFPKKEITYIFIYDQNSLIVSAKKKSQSFRFHLHTMSEDSSIQSYTRALYASLLPSI